MKKVKKGLNKQKQTVRAENLGNTGIHRDILSSNLISLSNIKGFLSF